MKLAGAVKQDLLESAREAGIGDQSKELIHGDDTEAHFLSLSFSMSFVSSGP